MLKDETSEMEKGAATAKQWAKVKARGSEAQRDEERVAH